MNGMNLVEEGVNVLKTMLYTSDAVLEPYQNSILEFFCIGIYLVLFFVFLRFIYKLFTSIF